MRPLRTRGEKGEDARYRIETWKESVERAQRITVDVSRSQEAEKRAYRRTRIGKL